MEIPLTGVLSLSHTDGRLNMGTAREVSFAPDAFKQKTPSVRIRGQNNSVDSGLAALTTSGEDGNTNPLFVIVS